MMQVSTCTAHISPTGLIADDPGMNQRKIRETRLRRLQQLIDEFGSAAEVARRSETSAAYLSQLLTRVKTAKGATRGMGDDVAAALERGCGKPPGWMDTEEGPQAEAAASNPAAQHILQLLAQITFQDFLEISADLERRAAKARPPREEK